MEVEEISMEKFEAELAQTGRKGAWTEVCHDVKDTGTPRKVSGLSRGQVSALARRAKELGLRYKANYSEGYVVLAPGK